jgi:flagellar motor component MotA
MTVQEFKNRFEELKVQIIGFSTQSRREGILALEYPCSQLEEKDYLLKIGLQRTVDGCEPDYIKEIYENIQFANPKYGLAEKILFRLVVQGVLGIQCGENPTVLEWKLNSLYPRPETFKREWHVNDV